MSYNDDKHIIFDAIRRIAFEDAKVIDGTAKTLNISQKYIYRLFIEYHELLFSRMCDEEAASPAEVDDGI